MAQAGSRKGKGGEQPSAKSQLPFLFTAVNHKEYFCLVQIFFKRCFYLKNKKLIFFPAEN